MHMQFSDPDSENGVSRVRVTRRTADLVDDLSRIILNPEDEARVYLMKDTESYGLRADLLKHARRARMLYLERATEHWRAIVDNGEWSELAYFIGKIITMGYAVLRINLAAWVVLDVRPDWASLMAYCG